MGRNIDPVCQMCRREGIKLYLKAQRCYSPKCPIERERPAPGMHGARRCKPSEYGIRLREKQRLKRFYGLFERQFRRYFKIASRSTENTGEVMLSLMERRLDNVVHRLGFAPNRASARQLVSHGHVQVNNKACDIPSLLLKAGDLVTIKSKPRTLQLVKLYMQDNSLPIPDFLERTGTEPPEGRVIRLPNRADVDPRLNEQRELREQLIIELSTR